MITGFVLGCSAGILASLIMGRMYRRSIFLGHLRMLFVMVIYMGLGTLIIKGYQFLRTDILFLGIFFVITLALMVDLSIVIISRKVLKWTG